VIPLAEFRGVSFAYPPGAASRPPFELRELSFSVAAGEVLGLIGPNAAGKTTVIRLLSHVLRPSRGEILVGGERVSALGRASVALARLRNAEVIELLATVIANLVEGEFMQLKNTARDEANPAWSEDAVGYYLRKTYLKTASLISKSCRAAALLGGADAQTVDAAYAYGKNLGLAFQLVDDMLDYTRSEKELGKPAGADLELGLATAPLLFAWRKIPELGALVGRKFARDGDVQRARELVLASDGVEQTRALAQDYVEQAMAAICPFPDSEAKDGLIEMAAKSLKRRK